MPSSWWDSCSWLSGGVDTVGSELEAQSDQDLALIVNELGSANDALRRETLVLEGRIAEVERSGESQQAVLNEAIREIQSLRVVSGLEGATGPGIVVRVNDPRGVLLAQDFADLLNELRAAGAEALDVDGVRISATSGFSDGPSGVVVDGVLLERTLAVSAIGDVATLTQALEMPGGVSATLGSFPGVQVTIREEDNIETDAARLRPMEEGTPF